MDIGAGDGRVLVALAEKCDDPELYAIEKSTVLIQAQPGHIIPVGTEFYEQNLACLPVDCIFCNPPYSQFEDWASIIIENGYAKKAYLVMPQRWKDRKAIKVALERRGASARVIHSADFLDADRQARAVVDVVEISYPTDGYGYGRNDVTDPFDIWFDQNISTFDIDEEIDEDDAGDELSRRHDMTSIAGMVAAHDEEMTRMENNYRAIFKLDLALLQELGVQKDTVRDGIKKKMAGLKTKYWQLMFERLDTITNRLSTDTKKRFLDKLTRRTSIAFTSSNAYAVVLWAIKNANRYYDEQLVTLFHKLSTCDSAINYKSNERTWQGNGWRYNQEGHTHYRLDYRFVVSQYNGIKQKDSWDTYKYSNNLHEDAHEVLDDIKAVFYNLGFAHSTITSRSREWEAGKRQEFTGNDGEILFDVRAFLNGNLHFRFRPAAIKALNVEAGRLLGWLHCAEDAAKELGYSLSDVEKSFGSNAQITPSNIKLLTSSLMQP